MRILIVRTDRIGDVTLATPLIRALRKSFPDSFLGALVQAYSEPVLRGNPHLDEVLVDDAGGRHAGLGGLVRVASEIRRRRFDTALLLLPTKRLAWALLAAGVRRRIGVGRRLYQVITGMGAVRREPGRSEADYCLDLGRAIGARDDGLRTEVFLTAEERERGAAILRDSGAPLGARIIAIHPGSGGSAPNWTPPRWAELARALVRDPDTRVVLTGGAAERPLATAFTGIPRTIDLVGALELRETMGVIARCDVLASASTGTMHLAAALGVRTVSVFCPLASCTPVLWGPQGNAASNLLPDEAWCARQCPGDPKICDLDDGLDVARVADTVGQALGAATGDAP